MRKVSGRRRYPPVVIWLLLGLAAVTAAAFAALAVLAWQQASQIRVLEEEVAVLEQEASSSRSQQAALQATTTTLENRLASVEANDPAQQIEMLEAAVASAEGSQEYEEVRTALQDIQARVDAFQDDLDGLSAAMATLQPQDGTELADSLPAAARLSVAPQRQTHNLSCESSAASMVAEYHGLGLSEEKVLASLPFNANPHLGFRGNVDGPTGGIEDYGVYAGPIMAILNSYGLRARPIEGGLAEIKQAIARGNPAIVWVTYNCLPSTPTRLTIDGATVTLVPNQHVVVVTGYDVGGVWANDPWDGQEDYYANSDFERAMGYFGNMAVEVAAP